MSLRNYLNDTVKLKRGMSPSLREDYIYRSMEELVLREGREFKNQPLPPYYAQMEKKMCFRNAMNLALREPALTYVEGYGLSIIPVHHAWCVDRDGMIVDPTWDYEPDREYFGIPFDLKFVTDLVNSKETYGVIDDWTNNWPLLRGIPEGGKIPDAFWL